MAFNSTTILGTFRTHAQMGGFIDQQKNFVDKEWRVQTEDYNFTFSYSDIDGSIVYPDTMWFKFALTNCKGIKQSNDGVYPVTINLGNVKISYDDEEVLLTGSNTQPVLEHEL